MHTSPTASLGQNANGGLNVYVREVSRELGRMGVAVDVFTRSQNPSIPRVVQLGERARVIHLPAGDEAPMARERVYDHLVNGVGQFEVHMGPRREFAIFEGPQERSDIITLSHDVGSH